MGAQAPDRHGSRSRAAKTPWLRKSRVAWFALALPIGGCDGEPSGPDPATLRERFELRALGGIPYPSDNLPQPERIGLGRLLFFDPILSGEKDVACGTCHHPQFTFTDGRQFAAGVSGVGLGPARTLSVSAVTGEPIGDVPRNTPSVLNTAFCRLRCPAG